LDIQDKDKQSRRRFLSSLLEAGLSLPKAWAQTKVDAVAGVPKEAKRKTAVSPAGSLSHEHLNSTCTGCQLCIQKCPGKVLVPCTSEYNMAGILQPVMDFTKGFCDPECTLCSEVCPSGSITKISQSEKEDIQIGEAVLVKSICLNSSDEDHDCSACKDACPMSAIKMMEDYNAPMVGEPGKMHYRRYPQIETILCIGCGKCEFTCPTRPARAIHVEGFEHHK